MKRNLLLLVLVVVTGALAWIPRMIKDRQVDQDRPELIYVPMANKEDALQLAGQVNLLRLTTFDPKEKEAYDFTIAKRDDRWIIPSHYDYPADGGKKVGETAGSVLALKVGREVTDDPAKFADLGVVDPADKESDDGHGIRIRMEHGAAKEICDLIVGKRPDGDWKKRYVRDARDHRVFEAELNLDLKTDFTEWVERDLLKVERNDIVQVEIENYSFDEATGRKMGAEEIVFTQGAADNKWSLEGIPEGKVLDDAKVGDMLRAIDDIRISGVRPLALTEVNIPVLQRCGFFVNPNTGQLIGNEGVNKIITKDGLLYHVFFGEVAPGEGRVLSAGVLDDGKPAADATALATHRYAVVFVSYTDQFDRTLQAIKDEPPKDDAAKPDAAKADASDPAKVGDDEPPKPTVEERRKQRLDEMRLKVEVARKRFQNYVFVISDDVFKRLRPDKATFCKEPPKESDLKAPSPIPDGMPGLPGMPPGGMPRP